VRAALVSLALFVACAPAPAVAPGPAAATVETSPAPQASTAGPPLGTTRSPAASTLASASAAASATTPPADCGMSASLVARGWPRELAPTSAVETPAFVPGTTTLAVLPDTQYYAACASPHFAAQARWVKEQAKARRIRGVITLGDLTDHNTEAEWQYIRDGVKLVEDEVPFVLVTGNHDHGEGGTANQRRSLLPRYFPEPPGLAKQALSEAKTPGDPENAYYRLPLEKVTLGVLALEWSPRLSTVTWANAVLARHPKDRVIVATHAYLYNDGTRYDWQEKGPAQEWNPLSYGTAKVASAAGGATPATGDPGCDGELLWTKLVKKHRGVFLVLSGHVLGSGAGRLSSRGDGGNLVQQVLVNYQMLKDGGLGYLRLLELLPDGKTLQMKSFSPTLGRYATGEDQTGALPIEPPLW
jgi:hypothetical protein